LEIKKGMQVRPYKALIYGPPGVGKSELANSAEKPFFFDIEKSIHHIDCTSVEINSTDDILDAIKIFLSSPDYKTAIFDTTTALQDILIGSLLKNNAKKSLEDFGYGKGYSLLSNEWVKIIKYANYLVSKGRNVIFVGHSEVKQFKNPAGEDFDKYQIQIDKRSQGSLVNNMDLVLFMDWRVTISDDDGLGAKKGVGTGERVIYTEERPAFTAKNRYKLPFQISIPEGGSNFFSQLETKIKENK
jgi:replication-associated recombination protein RarA